MGRVSFVLPAAVGGVIGIFAAASRENLTIVAVVALVAIVGAIVAQPFLLRELAHVKASAAIQPYAHVRDELTARSFRGPSFAHTRDLLLLSSNAYDLHFRFRPVLIDVVSDLLALRLRVDFHEQPEQARALIGPDLWDIVRPDRPLPTGGFSDPGLDAPHLERLIDDLERMSV
jgi:hypothetical protein